MSHRTHTPAHSGWRRCFIALAAGAVLATASAAYSDSNPEHRCQKARYKAAAKYGACQQKVFARLYGSTSLGAKFQAKLAKCRVKYAAVWPKLQAKANGSGSTCDNARFEVNADGTVTDRLTALQWEQKSDDASVHDTDNVYTWTAGTTLADGTAFTGFLTALNAGGCFADQCDWRLPTIYELQTILLEPSGCTMSPCIDELVFGPTAADHYWSATTDATEPSFVWKLIFTFNGSLDDGSKFSTHYVRAVRGGL